MPVLSQEKNEWNGETGYVQNIILKNKIDLDSTQVYACGSNNMIKSARKLLLTSGLKEHSFFSDAFIQTN
ncbi:hypothetical protein N9Q36_01430 [Flavobacteriales bacterium]|nr:hypothetical protein [Flavobacteriales bacterium]